MSPVVAQANGAGRRQDAFLTEGLTAWGRDHFASSHWQVVDLVRPSSGWANETVVIAVDDDDDSSGGIERLVVRLPALVPIFPSYDLHAQAMVLEQVRAAGVPAPRPVAVEAGEDWVGAPFLVMSWEEGHPGPEVPAVDDWLLALAPGSQRRLHKSFIETLARVHGLDWRGSGLGAALRGAEASLADEVGWWASYVDWATDASPPSLLADTVAWCRATAPSTLSPRSLCWGDARIGNVLFGQDGEVRAVLDWELATIGTGEMDVAWFVALDGLVERFTGRRVPGFMRGDAVVACYERAAGRDLRDLEWHDLFALTRSVAVGERLSIVASLGGIEYPGGGGNDNPVLRELARRIEGFTGEDRTG